MSAQLVSGMQMMEPCSSSSLQFRNPEYVAFSMIKCASRRAFWTRSVRRESKISQRSSVRVHQNEAPLPELISSEFTDEADKPELSSAYSFWNSATEQLAASATVAFLMLQMPQIILNARNLMAGNAAALFAVPWMGLLTGLAGNLSLLSYFAGKKENGAMVVQAVGVLTIYIVLLQLTLAGSMPTSAFTTTTIAVLVGYLVNLLNYRNLLAGSIWSLWQDVITVGGVSVLSQVMWSTFEPYLPASSIPGLAAFASAAVLVVQRRRGRLSPGLAKFVTGLSAWSATLLFMWSPIAQMWTNINNPANLQGLSVMSVLLAMIGNGLLLPRALFTRDLMWFTGSTWGALVQGWGILLTMCIHQCVSGPFFFSVTTAIVFWIGGILLMDSKAANSVNSRNAVN